MFIISTSLIISLILLVSLVVTDKYSLEKVNWKLHIATSLGLFLILVMFGKVLL